MAKVAVFVFVGALTSIGGRPGLLCAAGSVGLIGVPPLQDMRRLAVAMTPEITSATTIRRGATCFNWTGIASDAFLLIDCPRSSWVARRGDGAWLVSSANLSTSFRRGNLLGQGGVSRERAGALRGGTLLRACVVMSPGGTCLRWLGTGQEWYAAPASRSPPLVFSSNLVCQEHSGVLEYPPFVGREMWPASDA